MILGIAGKKQSGKNTTANILHGLVLLEKGMIKDFNIDNNGKLFILTSDNNGVEDWGEFDITRKDKQFVEWAEYNMWPYVKLYSFADNLKAICMDLFNIPFSCLYGTDDEKNQIQQHLLWENMPESTKSGPMTAREFMQFLGTEVMRKMYLNVWVSSALNRIQREDSELAIIADARFPNEIDEVINRGGKVIKLNRNVFNDQHASEIALDTYNECKFTAVINNKDSSIEDLIRDIKETYKQIRR